MRCWKIDMIVIYLFFLVFVVLGFYVVCLYQCVWVGVCVCICLLCIVVWVVVVLVVMVVIVVFGLWVGGFVLFMVLMVVLVLLLYLDVWWLLQWEYFYVGQVFGSYCVGFVIDGWIDWVGGVGVVG